jgi:hypothetical protein
VRARKEKGEKGKQLLLGDDERRFSSFFLVSLHSSLLPLL